MSDTNETAENGSDFEARLKELEATLASKSAELEKVNSKNAELIREKQKIKQKADEAKLAADDIETIKATLVERESELRKIKLDGEIAAGLTANNVRPEMARAVTAMMKSEATYEDGIASIDGKSIQDYMKSFLGGKDGAHFVRAQDSTGSGATGSTTSKVNYANQPFSFQGYTELKKSDSAGAAAWADATGNGYLNNA